MLLADPANANRTQSASGLQAYLLKAGASPTSSPVFTHGVSSSWSFANKGGIRAGDTVYFKFAGTPGIDRSSFLSVSSVSYNPTSNVWVIAGTPTISGGGSKTLTTGDRLVFDWSLSSYRIPLYSDAGGFNGLSNPLTLGSDGMIECFTSEATDEFDLYLSGGNITDDYYAFDIPVLPSSLAGLRLRTEAATLSGNTDISVDFETGQLLVTGPGQIETISGAEDGRFLALTPTTTDVDVHVLAVPTADNQIIGETAQVVRLTVNRPVWLIAYRRGAGNYSVWQLADVSAGVSIDDLIDVSEPTPVTSDVLTYDGTAWVGSKVLGSLLNPLTAAYIDNANGLVLSDGTYGMLVKTAGLPASAVLTLPAAGGEVVTAQSSELLTGLKYHLDSGFFLQSSALGAIDRRVKFDLSALASDSTTRTITLPDKDITLDDVPTQMNDLADVALSTLDEGAPLVWDGSQFVADRFGLGDNWLKPIVNPHIFEPRLAPGSPLYPDDYAILSYSGSPYGTLQFKFPVYNPVTATSINVLTQAQSTGTRMRIFGVLAGSSGYVFDADGFRLQDQTDITKEMEFVLSAISPSNRVYVKIPDFDVDLGESMRRIRTYTMNPNSGIWNNPGDYIVLGIVPSGKTWRPIRFQLAYYAAASPQALDYTVGVFYDTTIAAAVAGGTSVLAADQRVNTPSIGDEAVVDYTLFAVSTIPAGSVVIAQLTAVGLTPTLDNVMSINFEYEEF